MNSFYVNIVTCIDCDTMYDVIDKLDKSKATDSMPLTSLFNKCGKTCIFPKHLKCANVSPIFQKENPLTKKNYRPQ